MRIGQNPAKSVKEVARPARVTVAVLNYIPFISGFYADMLNVLRACLGSIRQNTAGSYDLLVFDNASCPEVQQYLLDQQESGNIQYLILSDRNLGKGGAWNVILSGAPGEIIAYTDNDCFFYPGWLENSLRLLESFPNVGMVTSRPFHSPDEFFTRTLEWARQTQGVTLEAGRFIPWETYLEFDLSLGQGEDEIRKHYELTDSWKITYKGLTAFAGASHYQFVAYKSVIQQFLPFYMDRPMEQVRQLDQRINDAGLLRLMTAEPYMMNMSNTIQMPQAKSLAKLDTGGKPARHAGLANFPLIKKPLLALYNAIFRLYYHKS